MAKRDTGQVCGKAFEQLAGSPAGLPLQDLAEGMVVDGFPQVVGSGSRSHVRNWKPGREEHCLRFTTLSIRHAEMAGKFEFDDRERSGHEI